MTNDALELLTCFQDGFDEFVAQTAEQCAADRAMASGTSQRLIEVTIEDVRQAGAILQQLAQKMRAEGRIPAAALDALQSMNDCANCH